MWICKKRLENDNGTAGAPKILYAQAAFAIRVFNIRRLKNLE